MIGLILGAVIGIGVLIFVGKGDKDGKGISFEPQEEQPTQPTEPKDLSQEEKEKLDKEFKQRKMEAMRRRDHLLSNLSQKDRELFESYVSEMKEDGEKKESDRKSNNSNFMLEIIIIFSGLIFVYGLIIVSSDTFYSPLDLFRILSRFFSSGSVSNNVEQQPYQSPFTTSTPSQQEL